MLTRSCLTMLLIVGCSISAMDTTSMEQKECLITMPDQEALKNMFDRFGLQYFVEKTTIMQWWTGQKAIAGIVLAKELALADFAKYLGEPQGSRSAALVALSLDAIIDEILQENPIAQEQMRIFREKIVAARHSKKEIKPNTHQLIIQDINVLKPYYQAIKLIREKLDCIAKQYDYRTGFKAWPTPNPFYCRTPKNLFLETSLSTMESEEKLCQLYTPFGEVRLLSGGLLSKMLDISKQFLASMPWEIEDVTQRVQVFNYNQDKNVKYGPFQFKKEEWKNAHNISKLYLIKSIRPAFACERNATDEDLVILSDCSLADGQYEQDKKQFKCLSEGINKF